MIMPSHAKNVKFYNDPMPLFARFQVESYLAGMFNPVVQLKSGGYIVIGVTEALVAIDVNSGKATKEGSIEETALKTNLEAAEEVARQLRLRDLAGLIVIDFIDMEERKNNAAVEKRFKEKLKTDRARIQVGRMSGFGLLEMSRQRLRPGMLEASTQPCASCHGTGLIRSNDSVGLTILRQLEEEGVRGRSKEVLVKAPVAIVNFLMNFKREHIAQIEVRYGMAVRVEADPHLISPDFTIEKFKTATRKVEAVLLPVISVDTSLMDEIDEEDLVEEADEEEVEEAPEVKSAEEDDRPRKKRRRRRRRRGNGRDAEGGSSDMSSDTESDSDSDDTEEAGEAQADPASEPIEASEGEAEKPKRKRTRRRKKDTAAEDTPEAEPEASEPAPAVASEATETEPEAEEKPKRRRSRRKKVEPEEETVEADATSEQAPEPEEQPAPPVVEETKPEPVLETATADAPAAAEPEADDKPRKRGWWSIGR